MLLNWLTPERTRHYADVESIWRLLNIEKQPEGNDDENYYANRVSEKRAQFRGSSTTERRRLDVNLQKLCNLLGFDEDERTILRYLCISTYFDELKLLSGITLPLSHRTAAEFVAQCIRLPVKTVCALLQPKAISIF